MISVAGIIVVWFTALQAYAVLLGGVFNIVRLPKAHFYLYTIGLAIGYGMAAYHVVMHIFRGLVFRIYKTPIWPPPWLWKG